MEKRCPRQELNILTALLFASGEPVAVKDMAKVLGLTEEEAIQLAMILKDDLDQKTEGISVLQLEDRFQMVTQPLYYPAIELLYQQQAKVRLTEVQLETLAIILYKQPVTRQEINDIRGVASDAVVQRLIQMELVEEAGRLKAPGRPILLKTTDAFLKAFQMSSLEDLPHLPESDHGKEDVQLTLEETEEETPEKADPKE